MRLLDRYILRQFLRAYLFCITAFLAIWIIFDFSDRLATFLDQDVKTMDILHYYLVQAPAIIVTILPVALLLAVVACLGRMSRTNEIVSMLGAGISVPRLLLPLIVMGLLTSAVSSALNYALAPHAEFAGRGEYQEMRGREDPREAAIQGHVFRNRTANRTWFIQSFQIQQNDFRNVQILQQDEADDIVTNYMAPLATYHPEAATWELKDAKVVKYDRSGEIIDEQHLPSLTVTEWDETPFRLASATMRAEYLSIDELHDYLHFNADFPSTVLAPFATHLQYRIALPWTCTIIVILAAPLAIGFTRKGVLASVAAAVALLFSFNFLDHLFVALGEGDRISAWAAAWTPNIIFAVAGLSLLYMRSTQRELRELNPFAARARAAA